jgi:hypothetical protein
MRCSIRYPALCPNEATRGRWCADHDPYICGAIVDGADGHITGCGKPAPNIVAYSTIDTDHDRFFCDDHYAAFEDDHHDAAP